MRVGVDIAALVNLAETITLRYALHDGDEPAPDPSEPGRRIRRAPHAGGLAVRAHDDIESDDELFNRILRRSLLDMRMLHSRLGGDGYSAAGVPWYATLYGRDSLIAATQMLAFDPPMAEQTLRVLAGLLGTRDDPGHDEEPGRVLHELRAGEVARLGLSPFARYYGTVDATPLFLCPVCEHADWTGDLSLFRELRGPVDAARSLADRADEAAGAENRSGSARSSSRSQYGQSCTPAPYTSRRGTDVGCRHHGYLLPAGVWGATGSAGFRQAALRLGRRARTPVVP